MSERKDSMEQMFTLPLELFNQTMKGMAQMAEESVKAMSEMFSGKCDGTTSEDGSGPDRDGDARHRVRLYDFTIVTLQKGHARVLAGGRQLDTERLGVEGFSHRILADYVRKHADELSGEVVKHLRVYATELGSWPAQPDEDREERADDR